MCMRGGKLGVTVTGHCHGGKGPWGPLSYPPFLTIHAWGVTLALPTNHAHMGVTPPPPAHHARMGVTSWQDGEATVR